MTIQITIPGEPVPWERHVGTGRRGRNTERHNTEKETIAWYATMAMRSRVPMESAVFVRVSFFLAKPNGIATEYPESGGDIDNYIKLVLDGMNDIVYRDDRLVGGVLSLRLWDDGKGPRTEIEVMPMLAYMAARDLAMESVQP